MVGDSLKTDYHIRKDKTNFNTADTFRKTFYLLVLIINLHLIYVIFHINNLVNVIFFICNEHFHTLIKKLKYFFVHGCKLFFTCSGKLLVKLTSLLCILKNIDRMITDTFKVDNNMEQCTNSSGIGKWKLIAVYFYKVVRNLAA